MNLIFDIGANRGLFTDKCIEEFPNTNIIVIEPNPNLFNYLKIKYENNSSIVVLNNIVSEKTDEFIEFYISNADTISTASKDWINSSRFTNHYIWEKPIMIPSINLDKLIETFGTPNLIKIDVEGYEYEVLKGLTKKTKEICFEWAEEQYDKINKSCEHLINLGYNDFGYIEGDEYLKKPITYKSWYDLQFHNDINIHRKEKWGMIWVK